MGLREEKKKQKQEAILQAALSCLAEKGYAATKMADVAKDAGVAKGTVFEYFESKENLFYAVLEWHIDGSLSHGLMAVTRLPGDAKFRLRKFLAFSVSYCVELLDYFIVILEFWAAAVKPDAQQRFRIVLEGMYGEYRLILQGLFDEGKSTGIFHSHIDSLALSSGIIGTLDGLMLQHWMDKKFNMAPAAESYFNTLLDGVVISKE
ncbi:MAG: TetR/AcrR family transcriptional regulator [Desulfovibrio sp.]